MGWLSVEESGAGKVTSMGMAGGLVECFRRALSSLGSTLHWKFGLVRPLRIEEEGEECWIEREVVLVVERRRLYIVRLAPIAKELGIGLETQLLLQPFLASGYSCPFG